MTFYKEHSAEIAVVVMSFLSLVAIALAFYGGYRWHKKVTPLLDEGDEHDLVAEVEEEDEDNGLSLIFDASNPPKKVVYEANTGKTRLCTCHGRRLVPGETVVLWPTGPGYHVLCADSMETLRVDGSE